MKHDLAFRLGEGWRCRVCGKTWRSKFDAKDLMNEPCTGTLNDKLGTYIRDVENEMSRLQKGLMTDIKGDILLDAWLKERDE